ncbi:MAG: hypothetical protein GQ575_00370 [Deltaproteobacteria bacterium]|nr:hypothetical protein [Deltaproteobacteria bacterium]
MQRAVHFSSENAGRATGLPSPGTVRTSFRLAARKIQRNKGKQTGEEKSSVMQGNLCGEGDSRRRPAGYGGPRKSAACQGIARRAKPEGHKRCRTPS